MDGASGRVYNKEGDLERSYVPGIDMFVGEVISVCVCVCVCVCVSLSL